MAKKTVKEISKCLKVAFFEGFLAITPTSFCKTDFCMAISFRYTLTKNLYV